MEFGGCWQKRLLHPAPELDCGAAELANKVVKDFFVFARREAPAKHLPVNVVDGSESRQQHVEHKELALHTGRNIILSTARWVHCSDERQILDVFDVTALVFIKEAHLPILDELAQFMADEKAAEEAAAAEGNKKKR